MKRLKCDLHVHAAGDIRDRLDYSEEMLVDAVAKAGIHVLAIACHDEDVVCPLIVRYAERRGVLLIPAIERMIEGKHVILLNPDSEQTKVRTFAELRALGRREAAVLAPHPYYPISSSLRSDLERNIDLFDAIEYCSLYFRGLNFNGRAAKVAARYGLPLVGTSDTHALPYCDSTFTWIDAEPAVPAVIEALRNGRVQLETRPRPIGHAARMFRFAAKQALDEVLGLGVVEEVTPP